VPYKTPTHREIQERSLEPHEWAGYEVHDPLGQKIGQAEEILVNASDEPEYIRIKTGFFGLRPAPIPVRLVAADTERRVLLLR
jgi:hypothetical protein